MNGNTKKKIINNYSVALLTSISTIPGAAGFLIYRVGVFLLFFYVAVILLLLCLYRSIRGRFNDEDWSITVIFTGIILPMILGYMFSLGVAMSL